MWTVQYSYINSFEEVTSRLIGDGMCICADIHVHANMPVEQSLLGRMCMYFVCACVHIQSEVCISVFLISGHLYVH